MSVSPFPPVFTPTPVNERVPGSMPLLSSLTRSSVQAVPGEPVAPRSTAPRFIQTQNGPVQAPTSWNDQDIAGYVQSWDAYVKDITDAYNASDGFERTKLAAQLGDAEKGRANAYQIAQLQAKTSRYGIDQQSATALRQLQENARQFDANHGLEMQKFGLDYANTYAQYASTPDKFFQAADFEDAAGRAVNGQAPSTYGAVGSPTPKTPADFAVLAGYPAPAATSTGGQPSAAAAASQGAYSGGAPASSSGGGAQTDGRVQALGSLFKALPPSSELGMNDRDYAVLRAAHAIIQAPGDLQAGALNQWRPDQKKILTSAIQREGGSAPDWWAQYQHMQPGQGNAASA